MSIKLGNTGIREVYLGRYRIGQIYLGSTKIYQAGVHVPTLPYLIFQFTDSSFDPRSVSVLNRGVWNRTSNTSANEWYWECDYYSDTGTGSSATGWPATFSSTASPPVGKLTPSTIGNGNYCYIVGYGNLGSGRYDLETMDRMFAGCSSLKEFVTIQTPNTLINVGGCFMNCRGVEDGALDQYTYWSTYGTNIANHSGTFSDCGSGTPAGTAELAQIPTGWGGTYTPASTLMTSSRVKWKSNYDTWQITGSAPTWTDVVTDGMHVFTTSSVSSYTGVSMNRSRISKFNGLVTTQGAASLYFYPCFMQHGSNAITWAVVTAHPNGNLTVNQGNTDMPGTLDYSTIGPFSYELGTYNSNSNVYFCFLVTDTLVDSYWALSNPYGVLYNSNFKTDAGLRWF